MESLADFYNRVRNYTEKICAPLRVEDFSAQPVYFVSPPKWHLAHSTWFFETFVLIPFHAPYKSYHADFGFLFNSYYNGVGERIARHQRGTITRPTVDEVYAYRHYVNKHMMDLLSSPISEQTKSIIELGLNHEQQHQELLLTDIKYILGNNPIFPVYDQGFSETRVGQNAKPIILEEGLYLIGSTAKNGFCFDNETPQHKVYINPCTVENKLVTNGEYLEFINAGGYRAYDHWLDDGWTWIQKEAISSPLYWHQVNGAWFSYQLSGLSELDHNAPVTHVSFYEAAAYASWKGMRLPTETEWEAVSEKLNAGQRWEWTNSAYLPYPGFTKAAGAVGEYNGKFMINQMVLRGGSIATPEGHSRNTYRNFFYAHERWQFTGIRLAK